MMVLIVEAVEVQYIANVALSKFKSCLVKQFRILLSFPFFPRLFLR
jgi:hypothetical protein